MPSTLPKKPTPPAAREDKVVMLLNKLGEQLIRSEKERVELAARLARLEQQQQTTGQRLLQSDSVNQRLEEAFAQQGRLNRKLEQVTQDKIRMTRKIERIEEAVVETRDALQSKALVLLTEQGLAHKTGQPQLPADPAREISGKTKILEKWETTPLFGRAAALTGLTLIALLGGWAAARLPATIDAPITISNSSTAPQPDTTSDTQAAPADLATPPADTATPVIAPAPAAAALPVKTSAPEQTAVHDDSADDTKLAEQLNAIEPGSATPVPEKIVPRALPKKTEKAAFVQKETRSDNAADNASDTDSFVTSQRDSKPLSERARPDSALPPLAQQIEKKALQGIPEAQHDLAALYTSGNGGVVTDYKKAAFWFKEASVNGVANARYNLGVLYQQGLGVDKDINKAIGWYSAAAKLGHPEAEYNLGIAHIEGIGTDYNPQTAARYFRQAANGGVVEAAYNLGLIEENGLLGAPHKNEALYWYERAADHGSKEGRAALTQLSKTMKLSPAEVDKITAGLQAANDAPAAKTNELKTANADDSSPAAVTPAPAIPAKINVVSSETSLIAQIQEQLVKRGLYPGPADGNGNSLTDDSIRAYQAANGLTSDGRPTQALLVRMLSDEIKAPATNTYSAASTLRPDDMQTPDTVAQ